MEGVEKVYQYQNYPNGRSLLCIAIVQIPQKVLGSTHKQDYMYLLSLGRRQRLQIRSSRWIQKAPHVTAASRVICTPASHNWFVRKTNGPSPNSHVYVEQSEQSEQSLVRNPFVSFCSLNGHPRDILVIGTRRREARLHQAER